MEGDRGGKRELGKTEGERKDRRRKRGRGRSEEEKEKEGAVPETQLLS